MDPRVRQVVEGAMGTLGEQLKNIESNIQIKMGSVLETCFSKNDKNADRFAECFMQKNKRIEDLMKPMEFKMLFFSKRANVCLSNKKSVSECTQEVKTGFQQVINNMKRQIERL